MKLKKKEKKKKEKRNKTECIILHKWVFTKGSETYVSFQKFIQS